MHSSSKWHAYRLGYHRQFVRIQVLTTGDLLHASLKWSPFPLRRRFALSTRRTLGRLAARRHPNLPTPSQTRPRLGPAVIGRRYLGPALIWVGSTCVCTVSMSRRVRVMMNFPRDIRTSNLLAYFWFRNASNWASCSEAFSFEIYFRRGVDMFPSLLAHRT